MIEWTIPLSAQIYGSYLKEPSQICPRYRCREETIQYVILGRQYSVGRQYNFS